MSDALTQDELRPYQAALVVGIQPGANTSAEKVLRKVKKVLGVKVRDTGRKVVASGTSNDPESAFVRYEDRRQVAWASAPVIDKVNHLVVVVLKGNWAAIHTTESSRRETLKRALRKGNLGPLTAVGPGHLKAAFMKGPARTLWMRGTHRSTPSKADSKVLGGSDLAPALDPLGDQSYRYTAARCEPENGEIGDVMGLAVDQSRLWIGPSSNWDEFQSVIVATLNALEETSGTTAEPLPVLAVPTADLGGVGGAYDIAIAPPEMLMMGPVLDPVEAAILAEMERFAFETQFDVTSSVDSVVTADVSRGGQRLGGLKLEFREGGEEIETVVEGVPETGHEESLKAILERASEPDTLTVYFDSGHTIQSRQVFTIRHRDIPFSGWSWVSFGSEWSVDREKPSGGIAAVGSDNSLFDWVLDSWPVHLGPGGEQGWLACDDRPGETADFLHIDESSDVPILTLIHVKGAKSASENREVAVVPYETVCSQAVKNLRHLDAVLAAGNLISGTIPEDLDFAAWENGETRTRGQFLEHLDGLGSNFGRRVAIVQPHVRKDLVTTIRADPGHTQAPRLRQLDTLLHGTAANCQSAGADFLVIGSS